MRIFVDIGDRPVSYRYLDSVHAAVVAGLAEAGVGSRSLVGEAALNWCFATKGYARKGGDCVLTGVTISTASEEIATAMTAIDPRDIRVTSSNGDRLDLSHGRVRQINDRLGPNVHEATFMFASPFVIPQKKSGVDKTRYVSHLDGVDIDAALRRGLERRAGRTLDIRFAVDRLSLRADGAPRVVRYRRMSNGRDQMIDAFALPVFVRGSPDAVRFAYLAGLGAKTRVGFGCPIVPR